MKWTFQCGSLDPEQATDYVTGREAMKKEEPSITPQKINKMILLKGASEIIRSSFLSHTWKMYETWDDIFLSHDKKIKFDQYKSIANSTVPDKDALRQWAEETQPTQAQLRERIRELTGDDRIRLGFRLMTTNMWKFASSDGKLMSATVHPCRASDADVDHR